MVIGTGTTLACFARGSANVASVSGGGGILAAVGLEGVKVAAGAVVEVMVGKEEMVKGAASAAVTAW